MEDERQDVLLLDQEGCFCVGFSLFRSITRSIRLGRFRMDVPNGNGVEFEIALKGLEQMLLAMCLVLFLL